MPADLSPYILAEQLRPSVPLHPIERQPHHYGLLQELMQPCIWKLIVAGALPSPLPIICLTRLQCAC